MLVQSSLVNEEAHMIRADVRAYWSASANTKVVMAASLEKREGTQLGKLFFDAQ